jgi:hypothetical protein
MKNLSRNSADYSESSSLGSALWHSYSITNNETYKQRASNITANTTCQECSETNFASASKLFKDAYKYGKEKIDDFKNILGKGPVNQSCNPINNSYNCEQPREQGLLSSVYTSGFETIPLDLKSNISIESPETVVKDEEFSVTCDVTNSGSSTVFYNSKVRYNSTNGLTKTQNTSTNETDLRFNSSINGTSKFQASETGSQSVSCIVDSSLEENISKKVTVTVEQKENSGGSFGGEGGGSGGGGIPSGAFDTFNPYKVEYNFNGSINNHSIYSQLNISRITEKKANQNNSCFDAVRTVKEEYSVLSLNSTCGNQEKIFFEKLPENISANSHDANQIGNFSYFKLDRNLDRFRINYTGSADREEWNKPLPIVLNELKKPLKANMSIRNINTTKMTAEAEVTLNRRAVCSLTSGNTTVERNSSSFNVIIDIHEGSNTFSLNCPNLTESRVNSITEQDDGKKEQENSRDIQDAKEIEKIVNLLPILIIIGSGGAAAYKRKEIIGKGKTLAASYYSKKMFKQVEKDNATGAIQSYEKIKGLTGETDIEKIIGSNIELDNSIYLYLSLDALKDTDKMAINHEKARSIARDAIDFVENNPDKDISYKIKKKLSSIEKQKISQ